MKNKALVIQRNLILLVEEKSLDDDRRRNIPIVTFPGRRPIDAIHPYLASAGNLFRDNLLLIRDDDVPSRAMGGFYHEALWEF